MGAFSAAGKDLMLDAIRGTNPSTPITPAALFDSDPADSITSVASTDIFTATAHGFAAGDLVVFTALTGGAGLVLGRPYFVIATNLAANTSGSRSRAGELVHPAFEVTLVE
jgi:hypothetical protein